MPSITPCLWFDNNLEEAAQFYMSIFPNSTIEKFERYTEAGPGTPGVHRPAGMHRKLKPSGLRSVVPPT